jgi:hypothetical protein
MMKIIHQAQHQQLSVGRFGLTIWCDESFNVIVTLTAPIIPIVSC